MPFPSPARSYIFIAVYQEKQAWKIEIPTDLVSAIGGSIVGAGVLGLLAASLCFTDPAMAFKVNRLFYSIPLLVLMPPWTS